MNSIITHMYTVRVGRECGCRNRASLSTQL